MKNPIHGRKRLEEALGREQRLNDVYMAVLGSVAKDRERLLCVNAGQEEEIKLLRKALSGITAQRDRQQRRIAELERDNEFLTASNDAYAEQYGRIYDREA